MIPAAIGTQVGGSVIRPASYCGNWALKPTQGALNRGERQGYSQSTVGVHAGSPIDMWRVAIEIAQRAGGDPGTSGSLRPDGRAGGRQAADARRDGDRRLEGRWTPPRCEAFERVLAALREQGVTIVRRGDSPLVESFERGIASMQGGQQRHLRVRESLALREHRGAASRQAERAAR